MVCLQNMSHFVYLLKIVLTNRLKWLFSAISKASVLAKHVKYVLGTCQRSVVVGVSCNVRLPSFSPLVLRIVSPAARIKVVKII